MSGHADTVNWPRNKMRIMLSSDLLDMFWSNHDPTTHCSRQYMSAIFYHSDQQLALAQESLKEAQLSNRSPITTLILPAKEFYNAEK